MKTFEASSIAITDVLTGNKKYSVPSYQRPYRWDAENAEQLAKDIYDSFRSQEQGYFIGSIICIKTGDREFEVVDGQQRLITLTLIVLQLARLVEEADAKILLKNMVVQVDALAETAKSAPSLRVREPENRFYLNCIVNDETEPRKPTSNQRVFLKSRKKIAEFFSGLKLGQTDLKRFATYLRDKVFVVFVQAEDRASSFRLFNVLNNRGMSLNDADLLKNHLLSKVGDDKQCSEKVEKNWLDMEDLIGDEKLNGFLSMHQISEKKDRDRVKKQNFSYYEKSLEKVFCDDATKMSDMLLRSSENHDAVMKGEWGAKRTVAFLSSLSLDGEWVPAFIAFLNKGIYSREQFPMFAELLEKVYMHALLGGVSKSQREAACYYAIEAINRDAPFDEVMDCLRKLSDNKRLDESLDNREFYDDSRPSVINLVKSVLLRVNEERHDDSVKVYLDRQKITVEHILPRDMSNPYWQKRFTAEEQEEWLHKLGNLTLLNRGKNSAARNLGFDKKKAAYEKSNQKSSFEITKEICGIPEWNMSALRSRHEKLKAEIMNLWKVSELL